MRIKKEPRTLGALEYLTISQYNKCFTELPTMCYLNIKGRGKKELKCKFHEGRVSVLFTSVTSDLDSAWHMAGAL